MDARRAVLPDARPHALLAPVVQAPLARMADAAARHLLEVLALPPTQVLLVIVQHHHAKIVAVSVPATRGRLSDEKAALCAIAVARGRERALAPATTTDLT